MEYVTSKVCYHTNVIADCYAHQDEDLIFPLVNEIDTYAVYTEQLPRLLRTTAFTLSFEEVDAVVIVRNPLMDRAEALIRASIGSPESYAN